MYTEKYLPEGKRLGSITNGYYVNSLAGLESAMQKGIIIEAIPVRCDTDMTLEFNFCGIKGIMYKSEALLYDANGVKDIAVITRVGKPVCFKVMNIIKDNNGKPLVVLSRRLAQLECIENYIRDLIPGDIIPCTITHLEHFGAFTDIGCGIVSLLPIDSISVSRISHPSDRLTVGMCIRAVVRSIDYESNRVFLSQKELLGTWEENAACFAVGQTVAGVVRSIEEYGIFVELAPNLAGLAEYKNGITPGKCASVYIKSICPERMKIKLVIIDVGDHDIQKTPNYFVSQDCVHIDKWQYSPITCNRLIESVF